ncbi:MAG: sortase [Candidatus Kaiserbacteria bacterium]|nr:sortase [Candidatus Kaiserbacteria bacterium]
MYVEDDMKGLIAFTARIIRAGQRAYLRKGIFLSIFVFVFFVSVISLARFDLLPSIVFAKGGENVLGGATNQIAAISLNALTPMLPELPMKIEIPTINLSTTIANPATADTTVLDQELMKGAVRYPTSARLGEDGNVVLFGHSSYLPIVNNQAYKTFNGIQKLVAGDAVTVYSSDMAYTYRVKSVTKENANDAVIPLSVVGKELTLSTCDSFAKKEDRFVVVADFVESHAIPF